jgi:tetratricopeptide (TPR) repeat protein
MSATLDRMIKSNEDLQMKFRLIVLLGSMVLLAACGGLPVDWSGDDASTATVPPTTDRMPPHAAKPAVSDDAVDQLLGEAMQRRNEGDVEGGISLAERALRIDPRSARVYYVLGVLQFDKGEVASALQLARKASSLDSGGHYKDAIDVLVAECELALEDDNSESVW